MFYEAVLAGLHCIGYFYRILFKLMFNVVMDIPNISFGRIIKYNYFQAVHLIITDRSKRDAMRNLSMKISNSNAR